MKSKSHRPLSKKHALAGALALGLLGAPVAAHANATGQLCNVTYHPASTSLGNHGYIGFSLYTGAACSGSYLGSYYLATTGSTVGYVAYNADQIQTMLRSLVNAMHANRAVYAGQVSTGQNGNVSVANSLYFY